MSDIPDAAILRGRRLAIALAGGGARRPPFARADAKEWGPRQWTGRFYQRDGHFYPPESSISEPRVFRQTFRFRPSSRRMMAIDVGDWKCKDRVSLPAAPGSTLESHASRGGTNVSIIKIHKKKIPFELTIIHFHLRFFLSDFIFFVPR